MLMIVLLEACYVHKEREEKKMVDGINEDLDMVVGQEEKGS